LGAPRLKISVAARLFAHIVRLTLVIDLLVGVEHLKRGLTHLTALLSIGAEVTL
jgi:hypothetical protein